MGLLLLVIGITGYVLWRRAFAAIIIRIRNYDPSKYDAWVARQGGQVELWPLLQLVYRGTGAITLILSLLFLLLSQLFIGIGVVLLLIGA